MYRYTVKDAALVDVTLDDGLRARALPAPQKGRFNGMLIAQAQSEPLSLISNATPFDSYGLRVHVETMMSLIAG